MYCPGFWGSAAIVFKAREESAEPCGTLIDCGCYRGQRVSAPPGKELPSRWRAELVCQHQSATRPGQANELPAVNRPSWGTLGWNELNVAAIVALTCFESPSAHPSLDSR